MMLYPKATAWLGGLVILLAGAVTTLAGPVGIGDPVLTITASNAEGSGSAYVYFSDLSYNSGTGVYSYAPAGVIDLGDSGANIQQLNIQFVPTTANRRITMNFQGFAGDSDTTFTMSTGLMTFWPLQAALAKGKATVTFGCTDLNNDGSWLRAIGYETGHGIFTADYNGLVPSGTLFSNLLNEVTAGPGGSASIPVNDPASGWRFVNTAVSSMSIQDAFVLKAGDRMSGQSQFVMTPEPASCALFALGFLAVLARRR